MPEFFIRTEIGGVSIIKVQADTEDQALAVAAAHAIDDWENAGPLKFADVDVEVGESQQGGRAIGFRDSGDIVTTDGFDASIYATGETDYEYAADDPAGRGQDEDVLPPLEEALFGGD